MKIGFSPCPNDTFIFDALINKNLEPALKAEAYLADVDELNKHALAGNLDVSKLSFGVLAAVSEQYQVLDAGSALGFGCGPLLIAREAIEAKADQINPLKIAIPGKSTTANLLLSMAFPDATNKEVYVFSDIEEAVLSGKVDAGLIIHENRFTYQEKGLHNIIDLGAYWEERTGLPIPLGCIAVKRSLPEDEKRAIGAAIRKSVETAFAHPDGTMKYVAAHAQEMQVDVMKQHIALYVNAFSISLGEKGRAAINRLMAEGEKAGLIPPICQPLFVEPEA
jgi:1,4-dihydroxy-6-naphthoate synthase